MGTIATALSRQRAFPHTWRLNRRRVASVGLALLALLGGFAYVNGAGQQPTYPVLVAARALPRGAVLAVGDLEPRRVPLPDTMADLALPATEQSQVLGQRLAEPLHAGVPLLRDQLSSATDVAPGYQRVAFPVGPEHAAGGRLGIGDTVRVFVSRDRGKPTATTTLALDHATVSGVGYQDTALSTSSVGGSDATARTPRGKLAWVEVLVDDAHVQDVLQALAAGDPDVTVLPATTAAAPAEGGR